MPLGTANTSLGGHEYADLILGPLLATSKVLPYVRVIQMTTGNLHVPLGKSATVSWVPEHDPIPESSDLVDELVITPVKAAALATVSNELLLDSSPSAREVVGNILVKSVRNATDAAFFTGTGTGGQPAGLVTVTGIPSAGSVLDLGGFADAIASIEDAGGTASVAWVNPADWAALSESLTGHAAVNPTSAVQRGLLGVQVVTTSHVPAGTAYVADGTEIVAAVRTDGEIAVSGEARFANYQTQIRVVTRIAYGFPEPDAIAEISA